MRNGLRALVYRPGSLGDTLVSLPAIAEIRRRYPEHRLTLLTESQVAGSTRVSPWIILKETGWFDDVCFYAVKPASAADRWHNLSLALRLRGIGYHDIFSLAPPRTTRQLRIGRDRSFAAWLALDGITRRAARRGRRQTRIPRTLNTRDFACFASSILRRTATRSATFGWQSRRPNRRWGAGCSTSLACGLITC